MLFSFHVSVTEKVWEDEIIEVDDDRTPNEAPSKKAASLTKPPVAAASSGADSSKSPAKKVSTRQTRTPTSWWDLAKRYTTQTGPLCGVSPWLNGLRHCLRSFAYAHAAVRGSSPTTAHISRPHSLWEWLLAQATAPLLQCLGILSPLHQ